MPGELKQPFSVVATIYVTNNNISINKYATALGVSPIAVAGAIAREMTLQQFTTTLGSRGIWYVTDQLAMPLSLEAIAFSNPSYFMNNYQAALAIGPSLADMSALQKISAKLAKRLTWGISGQAPV